MCDVELLISWVTGRTQWVTTQVLAWVQIPPLLGGGLLITPSHSSTVDHGRGTSCHPPKLNLDMPQCQSPALRASPFEVTHQVVPPALNEQQPTCCLCPHHVISKNTPIGGSGPPTNLSPQAPFRRAPWKLPGRVPPSCEGVCATVSALWPRQQPRKPLGSPIDATLNTHPHPLRAARRRTPCCCPQGAQQG